jgi:dihydrodipicolinate synthase/N-acetylneuraminate lyase
LPPSICFFPPCCCSSSTAARPALAHDYWAAISSNNAAEVRRIIRDHDNPFFELVMGLPGGFNAGIQAVLELKHIAQRWRRKPYHSLRDQELELLAHGLKKLGLLE